MIYCFALLCGRLLLLLLLCVCLHFWWRLMGDFFLLFSVFFCRRCFFLLLFGCHSLNCVLRTYISNLKTSNVRAQRTLKTATVNWYTRNCAYTHRSLIKPNQVMNLSHFSSKFYLCLRFCVCVCPDLLICELYRVWHSALGVFVSVLVTTEKYVEIFHPNNCGTFSNVCFMYSFSPSRRRKEIFQTRNCTCLPSHQQRSCWLFLAVDAYLNTSVNDFLFSFTGQKNPT